MTGRKILFAPTALADLKNIFEYIQKDSSSRAREWIGNLLDHVEQLSRFPKLGRIIPEIGKSRYRELVAGEYRIFHEIREETVLIFRIFHSKRLFPD